MCDTLIQLWVLEERADEMVFWISGGVSENKRRNNGTVAVEVSNAIFLTEISDDMALLIDRVPNFGSSNR